MENKQLKINWSIFYNRKLNQAQWRSLKNGPMRLTLPSQKPFKKIRDLFLVSKDFLTKFGRRSEQFINEGKKGEKKLKNLYLSWFQIVCFIEAGTFNPVRSEPNQVAEEDRCPAEHTSNAPEPELMHQGAEAITSVIRLEPGHREKRREFKSQQDVTRAKIGSNPVKLPNFRKRDNLGAKPPVRAKKAKLRLDETIDLGKNHNFDQTPTISETNR